MLPWPLLTFAVALLGLLAVPPAGRRGWFAPRRLLRLLLLAAAVAVPWVPTLWSPGTFARGVVVSQVVEEDAAGHPVWRDAPPAPGIDLAVAVVASLLVSGIARAMVRLPGPFRSLERLPEVEDAAVRARCQDFVRRLRLGTVPILEQRSTGGMVVNAMAVGGLAPFVVATDGTLHRLDPGERDAILAHELGHLARSIGARQLAATAFAGLAAVSSSPVLPLHVALFWLFAATMFLRRWIGHREEFAADRLGASLAGATAMAKALDKTHAANQLAFAGPWLHALASHPHRSHRAAALARLGGPALAPDEVLLARRAATAHRLAVAASAALLLGAIGCGVAGWQIPALLCTLTTLLAAVLPMLLFVRRLQRDARTLGVPGARRVVRLPFGMILTVMAGIALVRLDLDPVIRMLGLGLVALVWGTIVILRRREVRVRLHLAERLQHRDLRGWLAKYAGLPRHVRQRPDLWQTAAEVHRALGDRSTADAELARLQHRRPRLHTARLLRIAWLRGTAPAAAVAEADALLRRLPDHPIVLGVLAAARRAAGDLDGASKAVQRAIALRPAEGLFQSTAARIATARGDLAAARTALAAAERLAPGEPRVLLARAELAIAAGAPEAAADFAAAEAACARTLFLHADADLAEVRARLAAVPPPPDPR